MTTFTLVFLLAVAGLLVSIVVMALGSKLLNSSKVERWYSPGVGWYFGFFARQVRTKHLHVLILVYLMVTGITMAVLETDATMLKVFTLMSCIGGLMCYVEDRNTSAHPDRVKPWVLYSVWICSATLLVLSWSISHG